jgi:hypothetical protein
MRFYPTHIEIVVAIIAIVGILSWMGDDQIKDEKKTAAVVASIDAQTKRDQQENLRRLAEIDKQGRYMTDYDKIAANSTRQP